MIDYRAEAKRLMGERTVIEEQIKGIETKLAEFEQYKFDQGLADEEGFPRADLDYELLRQYRELKQQLISNIISVS